VLDELLRAKFREAGESRRRWVGLTELMQAVRYGDISEAASSMGMDEAKFREKIKSLEESLCTKILNPSSSAEVKLTEMGKRFVRRCSGVLEEIEDIETEAVNRRWFTTRNPSGVLRIGVPHLLGERYVIPALADFLRQYPNLDVELNFHSGRADLAGRGYDIAIEIGAKLETSHVSQTLATTRFHVCGSPDYFDEYGEPKTPDELKDHKVLLFSRNGQVRPWIFKRGDQTINVRLTPKWYSNSGEALVTAARHSAGLTFVPSYCLVDDIAKGTLHTVLDDWTQQQKDIQLIYLQKRNLPAKVEYFIEFIAERFVHFPNTSGANDHHLNAGPS